MNRQFREVPSFTKKWFEMGLKEREMLKKLVKVLKEE